MTKRAAMRAFLGLAGIVASACSGSQSDQTETASLGELLKAGDREACTHVDTEATVLDIIKRESGTVTRTSDGHVELDFGAFDGESVEMVTFQGANTATEAVACSGVYKIVADQREFSIPIDFTIQSSLSDGGSVVTVDGIDLNTIHQATAVMVFKRLREREQAEHEQAVDEVPVASADENPVRVPEHAPVQEPIEEQSNPLTSKTAGQPNQKTPQAISF